MKPLRLILLLSLSLLLLSACSTTKGATQNSEPLKTDLQSQRVDNKSILLLDPPERCANLPDLNDERLAFALGLSSDEFQSLKSEKKLTNEDICGIAGSKLAKFISKAKGKKTIAKQDKPEQWARLRAMQQASDNGVVKPDGYIEATIKRSRIETEKSASDAGLSRSSWSFIGPNNIGGRVRSIVIHPKDPNIMLIGGVSGGIWKTTNGGATWRPVDEFMGNLAVSTMAIDPTNPEVIYSGTGEGFFNADAIRGYGVFKSTDGGNTWNHLESTKPSPDNNQEAYDWWYVNRVSVATNGNILVATQRSIMLSTDGGKTWLRVLVNGRSTHVLFNPKDPSKAYANFMDKDMSGNFRSSVVYSGDGGQTWTHSLTLKIEKARIELAVAPSDSNVIYASVDNSKGEIYRSDNGGQTWGLVSTPEHLNKQGWYDNIIWVSPVDPNLVVIGGIDLYRSTDRGVKWQKISDWSKWPKSAHADHHVIVHHPYFDGRTNSTVFFGNDGGVWKTTDINTVTEDKGWVSLNTTLGITQFYGGAGSPKKKIIIGGAQDNGQLLWSGSDVWKDIYDTGDGGFTAIDYDEPDYMYGEYVNLTIYRFKADNTKKFICCGIPEIGDLDECGNKGTSESLFIAPFIIDPNNPKVMLAGGMSLWKTEDARIDDPKWRAIKPKSGFISAIAVAKGDSNIIWVGYTDGTVVYTKNGLSESPLWHRIDKSTLPPTRYVTRILIDKDNNNKVYVTFGGYDKDNIYLTEDAGATWRSISNNLPEAPIRTVQRYPSNRDWLYIGTEVGIFGSSNGGASWSTTNQGPANVSVEELFWYGDDHLVAVTHGRGMFMLSFAQQCSIELNPKDATHIANNDTGTIEVQTIDDKCNWQVVNTIPWVHIIMGEQGKGSGFIRYQVDSNPSFSSRTGNFTVNDKTFIVKQKGYGRR